MTTNGSYMMWQIFDIFNKVIYEKSFKYAIIILFSKISTIQNIYKYLL